MPGMTPEQLERVLDAAFERVVPGRLADAWDRRPDPDRLSKAKLRALQANTHWVEPNDPHLENVL